MITFDGHPGTRGARQGGRRVILWMNALVTRRLRNGGKKTPGFNFDLLLLTTTGRKSGLDRTTPLGWAADGRGGWLIAASANGAARNPAWYHNLAAAPGQARIELNGNTIPVFAEQLHGAEREVAWRTLTASIPRFASYPGKTDRQIPVIRLTPAPASRPDPARGQ
jgi:deazaflavin-dependent oxidoreductase (nitroreductase family)